VHPRLRCGRAELQIEQAWLMLRRNPSSESGRVTFSVSFNPLRPEQFHEQTPTLLWSERLDCITLTVWVICEVIILPGDDAIRRELSVFQGHGGDSCSYRMEPLTDIGQYPLKIDSRSDQLLVREIHVMMATFHTCVIKNTCPIAVGRRTPVETKIENITFKFQCMTSSRFPLL